MTQPGPTGESVPPGAYPPPAAGAYPPPAPGVPPSGYAPAYPAGPRTNTLAIVSLIASISAFVVLPFLGSVAGVITGHLALSQIGRTGEQGRGLALGGLIAGYIGVGLAVLGVIVLLLFWGFLLTAVAQTSYS